MFALTLLIIIIYLLFFFKSGNLNEKLTSFECGFEPLREMRSSFSVRFFILIILFLVFDVEISLLFPLVSVLSLFKKIETTLSLLIFLLVLLFGIFHEWKEGAIDWISVFKDKLY